MARALGVSTHVLLVHAAAIAVILGFLAMAGARLRRHLPVSERASLAVFAGIALSPMTTVFWETLGDPLHVARRSCRRSSRR